MNVCYDDDPLHVPERRSSYSMVRPGGGGLIDGPLLTSPSSSTLPTISDSLRRANDFFSSLYSRRRECKYFCIEQALMATSRGSCVVGTAGPVVVTVATRPVAVRRLPCRNTAMRRRVVSDMSEAMTSSAAREGAWVSGWKWRPPLRVLATYFS